MLNISNANSRMTFQNAVELLVRLFIQRGYDEGSARQFVQNAMPTQGYLRSEVKMSTSSTNYHVPVLVNDNQNGNAFKTERRLQLQDIFVPTEFKFSWGIAANDADGAFKDYTWEAPKVLTTSGASAAMLALYNAYMTLSIDNRTVIPAWDIQRHYASPSTQKNTALDYSGSSVSTEDSTDKSVDGFYPVEPNIIMNGGSNIQMSVILPSSIGTLQASVDTRLILIQRGILLQNVTSVK